MIIMITATYLPPTPTPSISYLVFRINWEQFSVMSLARVIMCATVAREINMQFVYPLIKIRTLLEESYFYLKPFLWAIELLVIYFSAFALTPFIP
jgi:hypothetical protein